MKVLNVVKWELQAGQTRVNNHLILQTTFEFCSPNWIQGPLTDSIFSENNKLYIIKLFNMGLAFKTSTKRKIPSCIENIFK